MSKWQEKAPAPKKDRTLSVILAIMIGLLVVIAVQVETAKAHSGDGCVPPPSAKKWAQLPVQYPMFFRQLKRSFGASWREAAIVAWKEGSWNPRSRNGQYQGTFQMGSWERSTFGHGPTLVEQTIAAAKYWRKSRWNPWQCKPW